MSKKPSCNLCGASLVKEDDAHVCGGCARPREEWLKDQAEQLAIAHQMGYAEGEAALRVIAQDHKRPTDGLPVVTHNVACCISPEELARRIREAKIEGAKDALRETVEIVLDKRFAYLVIAQAGVESVAALLENRIDRGEWPPKE